MSDSLMLLLAQINPTVGAIEANAHTMIEIIQSRQATHDLIVFPELALTGYPPEDLLFRPVLFSRVDKALQSICEVVESTHVVIGHPLQADGSLYNVLSIIYQGKITHIYKKQHLPNTGVFDEKRYFTPGPQTTCRLTVKDKTIGFCICEDIWHKGPVEQLIEEKTDILIALNASPFEIDKHQFRVKLLKSYVAEHIAFAYLNLVGGQDELVFDGCSFVIDRQGEIKAEAPAFQTAELSIQIDGKSIQSEIAENLSQHARTYEALKTGLSEYIGKNGFSGVVLGLSGGIDSALVLALAVDALSAQNVHALMMPSRYTADMSLEDAKQMIKALGISTDTLPIEDSLKALLHTLTPNTANIPDITQQNLQARIRGMLLMAYSNTSGKLVLSTSNKSESAVGYTTLYGDMCGAFAPIKDVPKTLVYELARYRNTISPVIPERIITRAPTAELAPNQTDQDSLPEYTTLDAIIAYYMNEKLSTEDIIDKGFSSDEVVKVVKLIQQNEYKRRQAPPGTKVTQRAFGRDWRYPITSKF